MNTFLLRTAGLLCVVGALAACAATGTGIGSVRGSGADSATRFTGNRRTIVPAR